MFGAAGACLLLVLFVRRLGGAGKLAPVEVDPGERWYSDVLLLLLPMTPIASYVIHNQDILRVPDTLGILISFAIGSMVVVNVMPRLLSPLASRAVLMPVSLALTFFILNMSALAMSRSWHRAGNLVAQNLVLVAIVVVCPVIYAVRRDVLKVLIAAYFVANIAQAAMGGREDSADSSPRRLADATSGKTPVHTPDIFLLTYDAYVENETMLQYGIDNAEQESYLVDQGFRLYKGTYSVGGSTKISMGHVLSPGSHGGAVSGDGQVQVTLKQNGYETYAVFPHDYLIRGRRGSSYDHTFPTPKSSFGLLSSVILEGEFRFDAHFDTSARSDFIREKRRVLSEDSRTPKFLFSLTGPGHSQNSGACLADETQRFADRLSVANQEMREDIEAILSSDRGSIIIVHGDHGPYLTKNCTHLTERKYSRDEVDRLDIQDRFGTFLAIRWPDGAGAENEEITVIQDVFPVVFAYLFDDRRPLLARMVPNVLESQRRYIGGVGVEDGVIVGGKSDGMKIYDSLGDVPSSNRRGQPWRNPGTRSD